MKFSTRTLSIVLGVLLVGSTTINALALTFLFKPKSAGAPDQVQSAVLRANPESPAVNAVFTGSGIVNTVKKVQPSVVSITATRDISTLRQEQRSGIPFSDPFFQEFFGTPLPQAPSPSDPDAAPSVQKVKVSGGSGFIYTADGLIMTNKHVVSDEKSEYTVTLNDGTEFPAEVLARDPFNDIAVVRIKAKEGSTLPALAPLTFGDSTRLEVGTQVVAIGNPLEFQNTVTTGIISGLGRNIVASEGRASEKLQGLLQTDAAINFGNSGGPLVNLAGEVIGMNTAVASQAEGIGFAIPANALKNVADSVDKYGKIVRPYLGIQYVLLDAELAAKFKVDRQEGALLIGNAESGLAVLKGSPAERAGLKEGDVLISIDGEKVTADHDPQSIISGKKIGAKIELEIWRDSKTEKRSVTLEELK